MHKLTAPSTHTPRGMPTLTLTALAAPGGGASVTELEGVRQIPCVRPHARQRLESEAQRDEFDDRRRVVRRVIDVPLSGERRHDDRRDTRARSPSVALRRRHVVPEAAV